MAQYYYAPKSAQNGTAPSEITESWDNTSATLTVKLDASSVPYIHFSSPKNDNVLNGFWRVTQDASGGSIPQVADAELYMEFEFNSLDFARDGDFRFCARADLASTGYALGLRRNDLKIISVVTGTRSDLLKVTASPVPAISTRYATKAKLTGTTLETKFWEIGATEPAYQAAPANSAITAAGYVGLYSVFPGNVDTRLYKFSVGTAGDPAPTEEPAASPTITTTLVADASDTALPASVTTNVRVFTTTNVLVGIGTITVPTSGAVSITDADLTLETGQSIADATTYRVDFQEASGTRQRTVELTAAA